MIHRRSRIGQRIHEIVNNCLLRRSRGEVFTDESIIAEHGDLMPELAERLRSPHMIQEAERQLPEPPDSGLRIRCPHCRNSSIRSTSPRGFPYTSDNLATTPNSCTVSLYSMGTYVAHPKASQKQTIDSVIRIAMIIDEPMF